jgi:hypothetical protein
VVMEEVRAGCRDVSWDRSWGCGGLRLVVKRWCEKKQGVAMGS